MKTLAGFGIIGILIGSLPDPVSYLVVTIILLPILIMLYTSTRTLIQRRKDFRRT